MSRVFTNITRNTRLNIVLRVPHVYNAVHEEAPRERLPNPSPRGFCRSVGVVWCGRGLPIHAPEGSNPSTSTSYTGVGCYPLRCCKLARPKPQSPISLFYVLRRSHTRKGTLMEAREQRGLQLAKAAKISRNKSGHELFVCKADTDQVIRSVSF